MQITLPSGDGALVPYTLRGRVVAPERLAAPPPRIVFSAAHVVADPTADLDPRTECRLDWEATLRFRHHLAGLGLGIAEAMDTAQRGMGLTWDASLELIRRTAEELPDANVFNGCGTDQSDPRDRDSLDDVLSAYLEQVDAIQQAGGRLIVMCSRALARVARSFEDYAQVYERVLARSDKPVILHWLGESFDPALAGYWGTRDTRAAMHQVVEFIARNADKIDGIKISLLSAEFEIEMRRHLPASVRMYTGDDFNFPDLIAGDTEGYSHALLGIFDPLANLVPSALNRLAEGDPAGFHAMFDPTVPLARHIFRAPTQHYKAGVVFLAWLNGHQDHFTMVGGAQATRSVPYYAECFRLADQANVLSDPDLAAARMKAFLAVHGAGA